VKTPSRNVLNAICAIKESRKRDFDEILKWIEESIHEGAIQAVKAPSELKNLDSGKVLSMIDLFGVFQDADKIIQTMKQNQGKPIL
jgi:hypothetical protein